MNPLGRLFHRPKKSRSTPTRLALEEVINNMTLSTEQPAKTTTRKSLTFPPSKQQETRAIQTSHVVTPMLITSSFYNQEYPFDDSSVEDEPTNTHSDLFDLPQQSQQQQQQQVIYNQPETQTSLYLQQPSENHTQVINIPPQNHPYHLQTDNQAYYYSQPTAQTDYYSSLNEVHSHPLHLTSEPLKPKSSIKRVPTPYTYGDEDYQKQQTHEQLQNAFRKLEKKHKQKEERVRELEYLLYSRSYDSTTLPNNEYYTTSPQPYSSYYTPPDYFYNHGDYYYANHTPSSSYQSRQRPPTSSSSKQEFMEDDVAMRNYYIKKQQQRYYNLHALNTDVKNKRWTQ